MRRDVVAIKCCEEPSKIMSGSTYLGTLIPAIFLSRRKRFIVRAKFEDQEGDAFLSHTGRLDFLTPNLTKLHLRPVNGRRFAYEVVVAYDGMTPVIVDSRLPNRVLSDGFRSGLITELKHYGSLRPEVTVRDSRFDFMGMNGKHCYIEVKGVTAQKNGTASYPDAPTERGRKHLRTMISLAKKGHRTVLFFLAMRNDVGSFTIDDEIDEGFSALVEKARRVGVKVHCYSTEVGKDSARISSPLRFVPRTPRVQY